MPRRKSLYVIKDVNTERKSEPNKFRPEKGQFFWCTQIQALKVKLLGYFLQNVHLITKYLLSEKISLLTSLQLLRYSLFRLAKG